jgi:hypothetical protein
LGAGIVVRVRGFGRAAQPYEACPSLLSARFSLGNFVFNFRFRDGRFGAGVDP